MIPILFCSCTPDLSKFAIKKNKPTKYYFTENLANDFPKYKNHSINALYLNSYKGIKLEEGEVLILRNFLKNLNKDDFIDKPENIADKPVYKFYCSFDNKCKYVINVYNEKYLCIYPWDGDFKEDYVDMKNTYTTYNLMELCKYIFNKESDSIIDTESE